MSERLVVIRTFSNEIEALIAKATLEAHDIPVHVSSGGAHVHPHVQFSTGIRVAVPESAVEDAEAALREVDDEEETPWEVDDEEETPREVGGEAETPREAGGKAETPREVGGKAETPREVGGEAEEW